jgi:hypothetical protein
MKSVVTALILLSGVTLRVDFRLPELRGTPATPGVLPPASVGVS